MSRIKQPSNAKYNTFITEVNGNLIDSEKKTLTARKFVVAFTSDSKETLSLSFGRHAISVPFEMVQELIDVTRDNKGKASSR